MVAATQANPAATSSRSAQSSVVVRNNAQTDAVRAARNQGAAEGALGLGLLALIFWPITLVVVGVAGAALTAPMNEPKNNSDSNLNNAKTNAAVPKPRLANQSSNQTRATIEELPDVPPPPRTATPSPVSTNSQTSERLATSRQTSTAQASRQISPQTSNVSASQNISLERQNISSTAQPKNRSIFIARSEDKQTRNQANTRAYSAAAQNNPQTNNRLAEVKNTAPNSNAKIKVASPPLPPRSQSATPNNQQRVLQAAQAKATAEARANVYLEEKDEQGPVYNDRADGRGMRTRRQTSDMVRENHAPPREASNMEKIEAMLLTLTENSIRSDALSEEMRFEIVSMKLERDSMKLEIDENKKNSAIENQKFREEIMAEIKALKSKKSIFSKLRFHLT